MGLRKYMPTMAPAKAKQGNRVEKYRALRASVDRSSYGDPKALEEEGSKINESLRPERTEANGLLLKR